jgi:glucose/arabinose dehydrogenase
MTMLPSILHRRRQWLPLFFGASALLFTGGVCLPASGKRDPRLDQLKLPAGFEIDIYAEGVSNARQMCWGDKGTLFVGTRGKGSVFAVRDLDNDLHADTVITLAEGLEMPNGVAFRDGSLYVAEVSRILRWDQIETKLGNPGKPAVVYDQLPAETHHGWKYIAFGPDGKLYVPVGAPCNVCDHPEDPRFASIMRMNADGSGLEVYASGVRNTVGFGWHPQTKALWFTDNGRDWLGDDAPNDELNVAPRAGMHFGFPYCHAGSWLDPKFGEGHTCEEFTAPVQKLGPHVAALGLLFYTGDMFPAAYRNKVFICEHGSWNRKIPVGYRITTVDLQGEKATEYGYKPFATGWLQGMKAWGRPVAMLQMPDGSVLVSDDEAGLIYRISYKD